MIRPRPTGLRYQVQRLKRVPRPLGLDVSATEVLRYPVPSSEAVLPLRCHTRHEASISAMASVIRHGMRQSTCRVLSLSGGGIRGYYTALLLWFLELTWQKLSKNPHAQLRECFDLVSGTSAGGINALAVAMGIPMKRLLQLWQEEARYKISTILYVTLGSLNEVP
ncbi:MAG: patatin-like phospholipase family protein [Vampirovibrionales bacterium]